MFLPILLVPVSIEAIQLLGIGTVITAISITFLIEHTNKCQSITWDKSGEVDALPENNSDTKKKTKQGEKSQNDIISISNLDAKSISESAVKSKTSDKDEEDEKRRYYIRAKKLDLQYQMLLIEKKDSNTLTAYKYSNIILEHKMMAINALEQTVEEGNHVLENPKISYCGIVSQKDFTNELTSFEFEEVLQSIMDLYGYDIHCKETIKKDFQSIALHHIMSKERLGDLHKFLEQLDNLFEKAAYGANSPQQKILSEVSILIKKAKQKYKDYLTKKMKFDLNKIPDTPQKPSIRKHKEEKIKQAQGAETYTEALGNQLGGPQPKNRLIEEYHYKTRTEFDQALDLSMPEDYKQSTFEELYELIQDMCRDTKKYNFAKTTEYFLDNKNKIDITKLEQTKAFLIKFIAMYNNNIKIVYAPLDYKVDWNNSLHNMTKDNQDTALRDRALRHIQFKTLGIAN